MPIRPPNCVLWLTGSVRCTPAILVGLTMTTAAAGSPAVPGAAAPPAADSILGWAQTLVPAGFSPSAAALLIFAIGLAIWLKGGRHLRIALAVAGGVAAAVLAWRLVPPAPGGGVEAWAPIVLATVGGAAAAAAARRLVATATLAGVFGLMAPAMVIAWDGMAAPLLEAAPAATSERLVSHARPAEAAPAPPDRPEGTGPVASAMSLRLDQAAGPPEAPPPPRSGIDPLARPEGRLEGLATFGRAAAADARGAGLDERVAAAAVDQGIDRLRGLVDGLTSRIAAEIDTLMGGDRSTEAVEVDSAAGLQIRDADAPSATARERIPTLGALGVAGMVAGLGLGLARSEFAARAATAAVGAALVILGGLHLPAGLVPGGWIGPTALEPVLVAWIAMSGLGTMLQWSYRAPAADIGR